MKTYRERELKFDVPAEFVVPDVSGLIEDAASEQSTVALRSTYYDTVDLDLLANKITLRRRTGDADEGWQLKVPASGDARDEISAPLGDPDEAVPEALAGLVAGVVRAEDLLPVATLSTRRELSRVVRGGELVVEIADDHVSAAIGGDRALVWREVEIELGAGGSEYDLAAFARVLRRSGAKPATSVSKLARALGRDTADVHRSRAGDQVASYLTAAQRQLITGDIALRRGGAVDVHDTRVAVRRIRSVLRVFADHLVVGGTTGRALDAELSWYQDLLGKVRDAQVQRERLLAAVAALPSELVLGPVVARIERTTAADEAEALVTVVAAISTNRYRRLLAAVAALTAADPVLPETRRASLRAAAGTAAGTAAKRLRRSRTAIELHRARKAAKRARYAAELVGNSTANRYENLQDLLGDHQDAVNAIALLRRLGAATASAGDENGFTFGLLYQRETDRAAHLMRKARKLRVPR